MVETIVVAIDASQVNQLKKIELFQIIHNDTTTNAYIINPYCIRRHYLLCLYITGYKFLMISSILSIIFGNSEVWGFFLKTNTLFLRFN